MRDGQFKTQTAGGRFGTDDDDLPEVVRLLLYSNC